MHAIWQMMAATERHMNVRTLCADLAARRRSDRIRLRGRGDISQRFNIAPSQPIAVVMLEDGKRRLKLMRWGLIPSWVKDPRTFALLFNARADGVLEKPSFRNAMRRRRCLIPADGFYEWQTSGARKRPFFIHPAGSGPVAFAGLWETWSGPNGEELDTVAIITTEASDELRGLHDRMPVVIAPEAFEMWLDCAHVDAETAASLLVPASRGFFTFHEVSQAVNRAASDGPELVKPAANTAAEPPAPAAKPAPKVAKPRRPKDGGGQQSLF
jgi:putative SOS response-associated peptidase YedK